MNVERAIGSNYGEIKKKGSKTKSKRVFKKEKITKNKHMFNNKYIFIYDIMNEFVYLLKI